MSKLTDLLRRMTGREHSESSGQIDVLPDHESGVRRLMADARGEPYEALRSLAAAQSVEDGVVVMEGDYGGQIYERRPVGAGVAGGMGGGIVVEGVWLHEELRKLGLESAVLDVIADRHGRIAES